jgi:hypothetical protein
LKVPVYLAAGLFLFVVCVAPPAGADPGSGGKPCRPLTCQKLDVECGEWDDGCGGTIDCGGCEDGMECDAGMCIDEGGEWELPACDRIMGTGAVTYTLDDGVTLQDGLPLNGVSYTYGLAALDRPNTLLATVNDAKGNTILRSEDAGCNWDKVENLGTTNLIRLVPAPGGVAYGWSNMRDIMYRIDGNEIEERITPTDIFGIAVNPLDTDNIRVGGHDCQIYESFDGGDNFAPVGSPAGTGETLFYTVAFDPLDWDRAICGGRGAWRTDDAGQSWAPVATFDLEGIDLVYVIAYSPSDPQWVWARASLDTLDPNSEREIYVSDNGGISFLPVLMAGDEAVDQFGTTRSLTLTNGPLLEAHPEMPWVLYLPHGTSFARYGTDLWRYDALLDELTVTHTDGLDGINAIEFSPVDPALIYLGLESADVY